MLKSASHPNPLSVITGPPIAPSDQISKITRRKKNTYSPSNLYLKGKFYYFRASIPKKFRVGIGQSEVRIGLQTPYIGEARRIATKLRVRMDEILDENVPVSPEHLRKELLARFIKVLEQDEKIHISHKEIKGRLQEYLRKQLDSHSQNINKRPRVQIEENESISDGQYSDACAKILSSTVNNPDLLANDGFIGVVHLMKEGVFKAEEVTKDNVLEIINEYIKTQITCHDIVKARSNGDYVKELPIFNENSKQINQIESQSSALKEETKVNSLKFSELANKYIESKIADGAWKSHSLPDHKGRLNTFIEVMGDKAIVEITRGDMRKYRDALRKLPPNRAKSKLYKGKSIDQILKMKPKTVYSVKTVNIFVEAASSLFEWAMREAIMTFNPAKSLSIKDDRQEIDLRDAITVDDLKILFSHPDFKMKKIKRPSFYWAPIIALYTGMRLEEIVSAQTSASSTGVSDVR